MASDSRSNELIYLPATFADDSYPDNPREPGALVTAQFPHTADMTWHSELLDTIGAHEVKYREFRSKRGALSQDLVARVAKGMFQAIVSIVDDAEHMAEARARIENQIGKQIDKLDRKPRARAKRVVGHIAGVNILSESPVARVSGFVGGLDLVAVAQRLDSIRNIKLLAARSVGAFQELISSDSATLAESRRVRLTSAPAHPDTAALKVSSRITRVFDEGNQAVTGAIRDLRAEVEWRLRDDLDSTPVTGLTSEVSSARSLHVGAGDLAAGYARDLYESADGKQRVADAFNVVVLNGVLLKR